MTPSQKDEVQILAISTDTHKASKRLIQDLQKQFQGQYDFPLLEDKNHEVIDRYGILNPDGSKWPHPATYVIDTAGMVRWKYVEIDYTKRPTNGQIIQELAKLPAWPR